MNFLFWSYTIVELSICKTRGNIRAFQRYFDSLTQKASLLLFITTITVDHWILDAVWQASIQGWENIGSQAIMRKERFIRIHKLEVEKPFSCIGQSTSDEKWDIINDWNYQIDMLLPKTSRHRDYIGSRHIFPTTEQQKFAGSQNDWDAWSYNIIKSYEWTLVAEIHAQSSEEHTTPLISSISFQFPKNLLF